MMGRPFSIPRSALLVLACVYASAMITYSVGWMLYSKATPSAEMGCAFQYQPKRGIHVLGVRGGSAAARAGVEQGDEIVAINGKALNDPRNYFDAVSQGQPGDVVRLRIQRAGAAEPSEISLTLQRYASQPNSQTLGRTVALELIGFYPLVFVLVAQFVLFPRVEDRNAWLLALVFGGFISGAPLLHIEGLLPPALRGFLLACKFFLTALLPACFYWFFAVFPARSPIDRRLPGLKYVLLFAGLLPGLIAAGWALWAGGSQELLAFAARFGMEWEYTAQGAILVPKAHGPAVRMAGIYFLGGMGLGLISLIWNSLTSVSIDVRRKTRVILWGTMIGSAPLLTLYFAAVSSRKPFYQYPFWIWAPTVLLSFFLPLSFAYAVVKYRVLDLRVLLKRSARYFLIRGAFATVLFLASILIPVQLASALVSFSTLSIAQTVPTAMLIGVAFGLVWAVSAGGVERWFRERVDRAFFRGAYDARHILQDLAEKTRDVANRAELGVLLQSHIREALHPSAIACYLEACDGNLVSQQSEGRLPQMMEMSAPLLRELALHGRPWEVPPPDDPVPPAYFSAVSLPHLANLRAFLEQGFSASGASPESGGLLSVLAQSGAECLVPMVGRDARLLGLIVLGRRLSEEPYSDEDQRLLGSVASQAAIALENIGMGERIALQMEAEKRAEREIQIAKEVQSRLFPQSAPALATLEYHGRCIQARTVGGDYYDFLDLGSGRLALVLADVAGKGIGAALLMANLQANLRSQFATAIEDLPRLLRSVNALFHGSTFAERFATMFFAVYDDSTHRLVYANCGHNFPLLVRASGAVEWLESTNTVLGLFLDWECTTAERTLAPGDTLVIYSDGVTEAQSDAGEMFGAGRLLDAVQQRARLPVTSLLESLVSLVDEFSGAEQDDDITLLVARAR